MSESQSQPAEGDAVATALRRELARGDAVLRSVGPVLRHVLAHGEHTLFSDDAFARVRGMLADLARQLAQGGDHGPGEVALARALADVPGLIGHLHGLALEDILGQRLAAQVGIDPVISPLLQALIGSSRDETQGLAMKLLAGQARFVRMQRRMELPLGELPGELLHGVLEAMLRQARGEDRAGVAAIVRAAYDEAHGRLGLAARLVAGMGAGMVAALQLNHAGVALFAAACGRITGPGDWQARDLAVLAMQDGQEARLALMLRAGGARTSVIDENLLLLHPAMAAPSPWGALSAERAVSLLQATPAMED